MRFLIILIIAGYSFYTVTAERDNRDQLRAQIAREEQTLIAEVEQRFGIEAILRHISYHDYAESLLSFMMKQYAKPEAKVYDELCYEELVVPLASLETRKYFSYNTLKRLWHEAFMLEAAAEEREYLNRQPKLIASEPHYNNIYNRTHDRFGKALKNYIQAFPAYLERRLEKQLADTGCMAADGI